MTPEHLIDSAINGLPFILYTALLGKLVWSWRRVRSVENRKKESRLTAILLVLTLCTLTFIAANAYAMGVLGKTLLSIRVFQMFVLSNCIFYWLVLDLVGDACCEPE